METKGGAGGRRSWTVQKAGGALSCHAAQHAACWRRRRRLLLCGLRWFAAKRNPPSRMTGVPSAATRNCGQGPWRTTIGRLLKFSCGVLTRCMDARRRSGAELVKGCASTSMPVEALATGAGNALSALGMAVCAGRRRHHRRPLSFSGFSMQARTATLAVVAPSAPRTHRRARRPSRSASASASASASSCCASAGRRRPGQAAHLSERCTSRPTSECIAPCSHASPYAPSACRQLLGLSVASLQSLARLTHTGFPTKSPIDRVLAPRPSRRQHHQPCRGHERCSPDACLRSRQAKPWQSSPLRTRPPHGLPTVKVGRCACREQQHRCWFGAARDWQFPR